MKSKLAANHRKKSYLDLCESPKTALYLILGLFGSFLDFESVSIQFLTPKNIGKVSKISKIGSLEAEIANFVKI